MNQEIGRSLRVGGVHVGEITNFELDNNVKRPRQYAQPRIPGQFFKSGLSVAPSYPPKLKEGPRGYGKRNRGERPVETAPMALWQRSRRLPRRFPNVQAPSSDMQALTADYRANQTPSPKPE